MTRFVGFVGTNELDDSSCSYTPLFSGENLLFSMGIFFYAITFLTFLLFAICIELFSDPLELDEALKLMHEISFSFLASFIVELKLDF